MSQIVAEEALSEQVEAAELKAVLEQRFAKGLRLVDLLRPDQDSSLALLILASDTGYQILSVSGDPLPVLRHRWPAFRLPAGPVDSVSSAQQESGVEGSIRVSEGALPPGFLPLGDTGASTWRRLQLAVAVDGDRIEDVSLQSGRLTCGLSHLARHHPYLQLPVLAEGLNEQSPNTCALATVLAVEALAGIDPPEAIQHARVFVAELERIQAHCGWLVLQASACSDEALASEARHARERLAQLFVEVCGRRRPTGIHLPGRILIDRAPAEAALSEVTPHLARLVTTAQRSLSGRRSWRRRLQGVGAIEAADITEQILSGPLARACGGMTDVRRQVPYLSYDQLDFDVPVRTGGDVVDRCEIRLEEMIQSLRLAPQALAASQGPLRIDDLRIAPPPAPASTAQMIHHFELWMEGHGLQPPAGATSFVAVEAPEGEFGVLLRSDGSSKPNLAHWRGPSQYHSQMLPRMLMGESLADARDIVSSVNINAAEIDR